LLADPRIAVVALPGSTTEIQYGIEQVVHNDGGREASRLPSREIAQKFCEHRKGQVYADGMAVNAVAVQRTVYTTAWRPVSEHDHTTTEGNQS
jgi:hypothetical protein